MARDHILADITRNIEDCNGIRYAPYRTAVKMQILHKELYMHHIQLKLIVGVFERHRLSVTENLVALDEMEIEDVVSDIYFAAHKEQNIDFNVDLATKLTVNYILNTFDNNNRGKVCVFSAKVFLTLLCCGKLEEKYEYLYRLLADHNACLSKANLHMLLSNICKITEGLSEGMAYGSHIVQSSIDSCFVESQGCLGVSETEFGIWLMQDPPVFNWISTFNRLKLSENIVHNIKCSTCKTTPINGPRFTCLRCVRYHQCQTCFFYGKISGKHKLKHPVREYCAKTSNKEVTKLIVHLIRNKLRICPTNVHSAITEASLPSPVEDEARALDTISVRSTVRRKVLSDPQRELQSIINHLEEENRQLQIEIMEICGSRAERLQRHRATVASQLQRLKILKKYLFNGQQIEFTQTVSRVQSTPMLKSAATRYPAIALPEFELSPIGRQTNNNERKTIVPRSEQIYERQDEFESHASTYHSSRIDQNGDCTTSIGMYSNTCISEPTKIELSTWIGGHKTSFDKIDSGFSQWLDSNNANSIRNKLTSKLMDNNTSVDSAVGMTRDTQSSLQRPDKHSQHSSLQNIQGDLNDILNRLQHMVANDCLLEESFSANDNCELKRAATEMEDLLTGLIEGMESRKDKLATVV